MGLCEGSRALTARNWINHQLEVRLAKSILTKSDGVVIAWMAQFGDHERDDTGSEFDHCSPLWTLCQVLGPGSSVSQKIR